MIAELTHITRSPLVITLLYALTLLNPCTVVTNGIFIPFIANTHIHAGTLLLAWTISGLSSFSSFFSLAILIGALSGFFEQTSSVICLPPSASICPTSKPPALITMLWCPLRTSSLLSSTVPRSTPPWFSSGSIWIIFIISGRLSFFASKVLETNRCIVNIIPFFSIHFYQPCETQPQIDTDKHWQFTTQTTDFRLM